MDTGLSLKEKKKVSISFVFASWKDKREKEQGYFRVTISGFELFQKAKSKFDFSLYVPIINQ